jgi:hypothetical protein
MKEFLESQEYQNVKLLATGEWAGTHEMIMIHGLFVGLDATGYRTRFCYPKGGWAEKALAAWDGHGDPPGPWIKENGEVERTNPAIVREEVTSE